MRKFYEAIASTGVYIDAQPWHPDARPLPKSVLSEVLSRRATPALDDDELDGLTEDQKNLFPRAVRLLRDHRGLLLCAPLGGGKTYFASALARRHARQDEGGGGGVVIVAPSRLRAQWQHALNFFEVSVDAQFYTHRDASLTRLNTHPRALWIVDEAHAFRNPSTLRYHALALATADASLCLVSATPYNARLDDVEALLRLITAPPANPEHTSTLFDALSLSTADLTQSSAAPPCRVERQRGRFELSKKTERHRWSQLIEEIATRSWPEIEGQENAAALLRQGLLSRMTSHPDALRGTLRRMRRYYAHCKSPTGSSRFLTKDHFRHIFGGDGPLQALLPFAWPEVHTSSDVVDLDETCAWLQRACLWLQSITPGIDQALDALLRDRLGAPARCRPGEHHPHLRRAVIFSQFTESARAVARSLRAQWSVGLLTGSLAQLAGATTQPEVLLHSFDPNHSSAPTCQVLVCTDVVSQGHNLQGAEVVIHLDRPWNPVKLAQREGRLIRRGQRADCVEVFTMCVHAPHPLLSALEAHRGATLDRRRGCAQRLLCEPSPSAAPPDFILSPPGRWPALDPDAFDRRLSLRAVIDRVQAHRSHTVSYWRCLDRVPPLVQHPDPLGEQLLDAATARLRQLRHHPRFTEWLTILGVYRRALEGPYRAGHALRLEEISVDLSNKYNKIDDTLRAMMWAIGSQDVRR